MSSFYDALETRSRDEREAALFGQLPNVVKIAKEKSHLYKERLTDVSHMEMMDRAELAKLPVLRKSELTLLQSEHPPFGGVLAAPISEFCNIFQSPGPIYEAVTAIDGGKRLERFLFALGIRAGDIVHNCFSYHFTPAGMMFDRAAQTLGALVFPAGVGQTELQVQAAHDIGATSYVGTPDYLLAILKKAEEMGLELGFKRAGVSGGALFPSLREEYKIRGITCTQCYATAELGLIAYETEALDGLVVDENVILEIVRPGTGDPVDVGEVGEVLVTLLDEHMPLIRFATGDLSALQEGVSSCGRTNMRIKGWMGRADQATKVKGMFLRPEQIASFLKQNSHVKRARAIVSRHGQNDHLSVLCETEDGDEAQLASSLRTTIKLGADVVIVPIGSIANDGLVIEDQRSYE